LAISDIAQSGSNFVKDAVEKLVYLVWEQWTDRSKTMIIVLIIFLSYSIITLKKAIMQELERD